MATKFELLLEAERRGILPPEKKKLLDEARSRGLLDGSVDDADLGDEYVTQPNLSFLPAPFGQAAAAIGYDGVPRKIDGDYKPSSVPVLDPISTAANRAVEAVPIVGPALANLGRSIEEKAYGEEPGTRARIEAANAEQYPEAAIGGDVVGTVAPIAALGATGLGARLLGTKGALVPRVAAGVGSGAVISGADKFARTGDVNESLRTAATGGAVGGALPLAAKGASVLWGGVKKALSAGANAGLVDDAVSSELSAAARDLFKRSEQAGVAVKSDSFSRFVDDVIANSQRGTFKPNAKLDEKATALFDELSSVRDQISNTGLDGVGGTISLTDLHELRQIAGKVAMSGEGRDATFASKIIEQLDDYVDTLAGTDVVGGVDPTSAAKALQDGMATWHAARKAGALEEAIYRAQHAASGFENGLRVEFRKILNNERKRVGFSEDELNAIAEVVDGTVGANLAKLIGRFGFGGGNAGNALGGTLGMMAGSAAGGAPVGAALSMGASGSRALSQKLTVDAAGRALNKVKDGAPVLRTAPKSTGTITLKDYLHRGMKVKGVDLPLSVAPAYGALEATRH